MLNAAEKVGRHEFWAVWLNNGRQVGTINLVW